MMFEADVACLSCHDIEANNSIIPKKENCLVCHEEKIYLDKFETWRKSTNDAITTIENGLRESTKLPLSPEQAAEVEWVKKILSLLNTDNSKGAHNSAFYEAVLIECQTRLNNINPSK
jgi:hypothetical protein